MPSKVPNLVSVKQAIFRAKRPHDSGPLPICWVSGPGRLRKCLWTIKNHGSLPGYPSLGCPPGPMGQRSLLWAHISDFTGALPQSLGRGQEPSIYEQNMSLGRGDSSSCLCHLSGISDFVQLPHWWSSHILPLTSWFGTIQTPEARVMF